MASNGARRQLGARVGAHSNGARRARRNEQALARVKHSFLAISAFLPLPPLLRALYIAAARAASHRARMRRDICRACTALPFYRGNVRHCDINKRGNAQQHLWHQRRHRSVCS